MAEQHNQQHLAYLRQHQAVSRHQLRQVDSEHQAPQVALAEAALEAHLQQRVSHLDHLKLKDLEK